MTRTSIATVSVAFVASLDAATSANAYAEVGEGPTTAIAGVLGQIRALPPALRRWMR